jgi:hypothetical protein
VNSGIAAQLASGGSVPIRAGCLEGAANVRFGSKADVTLLNFEVVS